MKPMIRLGGLCIAGYNTLFNLYNNNYLKYFYDIVFDTFKKDIYFMQY